MNELALTGPAELMRAATDVAGLCKQIVAETAVTIGAKKYPPVEAWQTIATAHGCIASSDEPKRMETGYQARGYLRRISDGAEIAEAYGFVGDDEELWAGRKEYARRAMAQTRAISRACRSAFAHVITMMKIENMCTTPYEEIPQEDKTVSGTANPFARGSTQTSGDIQSIQGTLTKVGYTNEWWNGYIKGIKVGTKDKNFEKSLWQLDNQEVIATIERKLSKQGKPWFQLISLKPASMEEPLNINPEDESQDDINYEPGSEG